MLYVSMRCGRNVVALAGLALAAQAAPPTALASDVQVIFTKIDGHPTAVVPGTLDPSGQPVLTHWRSMLELSVSPDGSHWLIRGASQNNGGENVMVMGSGLSGTMFAQRNRPMPGAPAGVVYDFFQGIGRFNNLNHMAYRARGMGTNTLQYALVWTPTLHTVTFKQGDPIQGLLTTGGAPGQGFFGNSISSLHIDDNGRVGSQDSTITGIATGWRPAIMYDDVAFQQNRNPAHQIIGLDGQSIHYWGPNSSNIGGGPAADSFFTSADGQQWIARGGIADQPSDMHQALVVSGRIFAQQGHPLPGTSVIVNSIVETDMAASGNWVARGTILGGGAWAMFNGVVVAHTGLPIASGSSELWGDSFLAISCNSNGDWVLTGTTQIGDPAVDTVIVLNGERVLVREGEQISLTGPGITHGVFIGQANNTLTAFGSSMTKIANDRMVYFVANLHDGMGSNYNLANFSTSSALLRIDASAGGPCYANCDGSTVPPVLNVEDFTCFINEFASAQGLPHEQQVLHYANCDQSTTAPVLNVEDFTCFINQFAQGCP
jgi:hypothetical protein